MLNLYGKVYSIIEMIRDLVEWNYERNELKPTCIVLSYAEMRYGMSTSCDWFNSLIFVNCFFSARLFYFRGTFSGLFSLIPFKAWKRKSAEEWNFTFTRLAIRHAYFPWKQKLGVVRMQVEIGWEPLRTRGLFYLVAFLVRTSQLAW